jgi:ATP-dependent DNA helicase HFM1/MER3
LKREFEFSDDEDMEVVDLAQDRPPTSYSDLAPRDYRKLHNLHNSIQEDTKALRLMSQKPQYQYGSGDPPQLPFALDTRSSEDLFDELDYEDEDFPSPSALLPGSRNNKITPAASCGVAPGSEDFMVEEFSHSGISHNEASDLFGEDTVFSAEQRPASSFDNSSMDSLEAGMLDLGEPMTEPVLDTENPKLNSSFVDGVFDFEAFNNGEDSQGSRLSLSAYQPAGLQPPTTKYTQQPMKRLRSPSPEEEVVKCRRIAKDHNVTHTPQEASEPPKPIYPEWLSEFDQDLIDEFKDIVDFID